MRAAWFTIPLALVMGCGTGGPAPKENPAEPPKVVHDHSKVGPHGGTLAEWGDHEYHVEFKVDHTARQVTTYILNGEAKSARPIVADHLTLTLKITPPVTVSLRPEPQPGDPAGSASRFVGMHDVLERKQAFAGTVSAQVGTRRYSGDFTEPSHSSHPGEPAEASAAQPTQREKDLFLKPGGIYTQADIEKNGSIVPSVKYRGLAFDHDDNLKPGDKICPVTVNKADEKCDWWVNGKQYLFCCPPCLDKFVRQAKESPEKIKEPSAYIKK